MLSRTSTSGPHERTVALATPAVPGAIAILVVLGDRMESLLTELTGAGSWRIGELRLVDIAGVDQGLVGLVTERIAHLMPHGGVRVVEQIFAALDRLGVSRVADAELQPSTIFPEASGELEALMLRSVARAASPLAVDLLLDQPRRWHAWLERPIPSFAEIEQRSRRLNRLLQPPTVVVAGAPNVGKSTLSNALLGRTMSIATDVPGTTRDYVAGQIDLAGIVVNWHDTPGLRQSDDSIEQRAIALARTLIERADLLIAMRDPETGWPVLPCSADLFVVNKIDEPNQAEKPGCGLSADSPLAISARNGHGLSDLVALVAGRLVPESERQSPLPWVFDDRLREIYASGGSTLS